MAKRKVIQQRDPFGRLQSTYEEETEEVDGILQDGETLRVPMFMMDGHPNPMLTEVQRAVATSQNKLLVTDGSSDPLAMHRPGFRFSTNAGERAAADAALAEAYQARELADREAWRSNDEGDHPLLTQNRGLSPGRQEGECVPDKQHDAQSVADAYEQYDREAEAAWRT